MIVKKNKVVSIFWIVLGVIIFVQCKKEEVPPPDDKPVEIKARDEFYKLNP